MTTSPPVRSEPRPFAVWPTVGVIALMILAPIVAHVLYAFGAAIVEGFGIVPPRSAADASSSSVDAETNEAIFYLVDLGALLRLLPAVARRSLAALGFSPAGLRAGRDLAAGAGCAVALAYASSLFRSAIGQTNHRQVAFEHLHPRTAGELAIVGLVFIILAPVTEELLFRGLIFSALAERMPRTVAAAISALAFGAIHADLVLLLPIALMGYVAALLYARTGNLWSSIALHATNNAFAFASLVVGALETPH